MATLAGAATTLAAQEPPLKEGMETITQMITQDTEPDPEEDLEGGASSTSRLPAHLARGYRHASRPQKQRQNLQWLQGALCGGLSKVIREVVVRPANEPEHEAVELLANTLEKAPGLLQLDIDLGYGQPPDYQWVEQGVYIIARPWPQVGLLFYQE